MHRKTEVNAEKWLLSVSKHYPLLKRYFDDKVAESKNKMFVAAAISCRVIDRAFTVINGR
jgi:hypothetical protein